MTSYVESVLASGENIVHRAAVSHWHYAVSYLFGIVLVAGGVAAYVMRAEQSWHIAGAAALAIGVIVILVTLIRRSTTELVLTDRRIIAKRGFISRDTVEMNLGKVESVHVNQSFMGRMLDYGDVSVVGTGSSLEPLRAVSRPLELRRKLGELSQK
ncbi:MAG TPA: PH domain-containing protein [Burkholderiales bacterium]|nr:PH domain-containing protein [Burkholderiales bacterium]